eukprot:g13826.t1
MTSPLLLAFLLFSEPHRELTKKVAQVVPVLYWPVFWDILLEDIPQLILPVHIVSTTPHWEVDTLTVVSLSGSAIMTLLNLIRVFNGCRKSAKIHLAELKRSLKPERKFEISSVETGDSNNVRNSQNAYKVHGEVQMDTFNESLDKKDMDEINEPQNENCALEHIGTARAKEAKNIQETYEKRISVDEEVQMDTFNESLDKKDMDEINEPQNENCALEHIGTARAKEAKNIQETYEKRISVLEKRISVLEETYEKRISVLEETYEKRISVLENIATARAKELT